MTTTEQSQSTLHMSSKRKWLLIAPMMIVLLNLLVSRLNLQPITLDEIDDKSDALGTTGHRWTQHPYILDLYNDLNSTTERRVHETSGDLDKTSTSKEEIQANTDQVLSQHADEKKNKTTLYRSKVSGRDKKITSASKTNTGAKIRSSAHMTDLKEKRGDMESIGDHFEKGKKNRNSRQSKKDDTPGKGEKDPERISSRLEKVDKAKEIKEINKNETTKGAKRVNNLHSNKQHNIKEVKPRAWFSRTINLNHVNAALGRQINETPEQIEQRIGRKPKSGDLDVGPPKKVRFLPFNGTSYVEGKSVEAKCVSMAEWQTMSFPTCNTMHESNLALEIQQHLNLGEYRDVWRVKIGSESFALKTLRLDNEKMFSPERAEQHRIDAVASERLSSSPYVANIYGYCGQSVINGLGQSSGHLLRSKDHSSKQKLKFALDAARGIADAHGLDRAKGASLVHRDVRGPNFLVSTDSKSFVLHDFNCARFIKWDASTKTSCAFLKKNCNPYRSPEECLGKPLTEKVDVYSLGNVFYEILTGQPPYIEELKDVQSKLILNGTTPVLSSNITSGADPNIMAIVKAMEQCHTYNAVDRPSAKQIVSLLQKAFNKTNAETSKI